MFQRMIDGLPELNRRAMLAATSGMAGAATLSSHVGEGTPRLSSSLTLQEQRSTTWQSADPRNGGPAALRSGQTPHVFRRIGMVTGGSFEGERRSGEVVSGNDWQGVRKDDCTRLDVRLLLKTMDDALIVMTCQCLRSGSVEALAKLDRGEAVDPAGYYFRFIALFETSAPKYDWINRIVAVGIGERLADGPLYDVFEVL